MGNFDEVLQKTVISNRRVVIPNLGAFINNPAEKTIVFSTLLKSDDGFLEKKLQENGVKNPANILKKFNSEIINKTERGEQVSIPGLGYFAKQNEKLQFVIERKQAEKLPSVIEKPAKNKPVKAAKSKSGMIVSLAFACFATFLILLFLTYKIFEAQNNSNQLVPQHQQTENQFVITDKTMESEANSALFLSSGKNSFYVVAACFEEKINAERFLARCKNEGFETAVIASPIGNLFPVAIGNFASYNDAIKHKELYDSQFRESAWIYATK